MSSLKISFGLYSKRHYKLQDIGYKIEREVVRDVIYEKYILGSVRADMIVNNEYIIEMKSISKIGEKK